MGRTVKTAVSLDRELFDRTDQLAGSLQVSRSHLVSLALEEFLRYRENTELLRRLNDAWGDEETASERRVRHGMRRKGRRLVDSEW